MSKTPDGAPSFHRKTHKFEDYSNLTVDEREKLLCEEKLKYSEAVKILYQTYQKYKHRRILRDKMLSVTNQVNDLKIYLKEYQLRIIEDSTHLSELESLINESKEILQYDSNKLKV